MIAVVHANYWTWAEDLTSSPEFLLFIDTTSAITSTVRHSHVSCLSAFSTYIIIFVFPSGVSCVPTTYSFFNVCLVLLHTVQTHSFYSHDFFDG